MKSIHIIKPEALILYIEHTFYPEKLYRYTKKPTEL